MSSIKRILLAWSGWRFQRVRADYYDYLACLLKGAQGSLTLRDVFRQDAQRYGIKTARGRLSAHWEQLYPLVGGDLWATWYDQIPQNELVVVRMGQQAGNAALVKVFGDLTQACRLIAAARGLMWSGLWPAVLALCLLVIMTAAIPFFTVPRLEQVFSGLPPAYYGATAQALFDFAALVKRWWWWFALSLVVFPYGLIWSLPNLTGPLRSVLDVSFLWRLYRYAQSMRFLATLVVILGAGRAESVQLRTAIETLRSGSSRWLEWHLCQMLERIDMGMVGPQSFDTGLFDNDLQWFLHDMALARGLLQGLSLTQNRLETHMLGTVKRQVAVLRWTVLLTCVVCLLALGLWHYAAIDDLRRSLMIFYAGH